MNLKRITLDDTVEETVNKINENSTDIEENVSRIEADFISYKDDITLKTSKIEKELNDYKATMQQVNINQEPKQKVSGYGTVSLPKNAANGQVSVTLFGNTEVDEEGNTKSTVSAIRVKSVGKNLIDKDKIIYNKGIDGSNGKEVVTDLWHSTPYIKINPVKKYTFKFTSGSDFYGLAVYDANKNYIIGNIYNNFSSSGLGYTDGNILILNNIPNNACYIRLSIRNIYDLDTIQLEEGDTATDYEPYKESTLYITAKDEEGNIIKLHSLPNGVKDRIYQGTDRKWYLEKNVSNWYTIKDTDILNIEEKNNVDIVKIQLPSDCINDTLGSNGGRIYIQNIPLGEPSHFDIDDVSYIGTWTGYSSANRMIAIVVEKGTTLEQAKEQIVGIQLIYQLATPIEIPVQVSGNLISYPSGTVYVENVVADAGVYTDKITILHQDALIKRLDKLSKVDFMTGIETELDISQAEISEDKLSFTHPDLSEGDIVFFEYEYDVESTEGETEVEFYDSRYVIKDSVTEKFYKWNIVVTNGQPSIELVEV